MYTYAVEYFLDSRFCSLKLFFLFLQNQHCNFLHVLLRKHHFAKFYYITSHWYSNLECRRLHRLLLEEKKSLYDIETIYLRKSYDYFSKTFL